MALICKTEIPYLTPPSMKDQFLYFLELTPFTTLKTFFLLKMTINNKMNYLLMLEIKAKVRIIWRLNFGTQCRQYLKLDNNMSEVYMDDASE